MMTELHSLELELVEPTPENSILVDVMRGDWPSMQDVAESIAAGKLVWYYYAIAHRAQFGIGQLRPGVVTLFDVDGGRSTFADVCAAVDCGVSIVRPLLHD